MAEAVANTKRRRTRSEQTETRFPFFTWYPTKDMIEEYFRKGCTSEAKTISFLEEHGCVFSDDKKRILRVVPI